MMFDTLTSELSQSLTCSVSDTSEANVMPKQGKEYVDHPPHYSPNCTVVEMQAIVNRIQLKGYVEAIDVIDTFFSLNFCLGSAFRYMSRLGKKDDDLTELDKAIWYLQHERALRQMKRSQS